MKFNMIFLMEINIFEKYGYLTKMQKHVVVLFSSYKKNRNLISVSLSPTKLYVFMLIVFHVLTLYYKLIIFTNARNTYIQLISNKNLSFPFPHPMAQGKAWTKPFLQL